MFESLRREIREFLKDRRDELKRMKDIREASALHEQAKKKAKEESGGA